MKKILALILVALMTVSMFAACGAKTENAASASSDAAASAPAAEEEAPAASSETDASGASYTIGICNYVDDASLNQIVENIQSQLAAIGAEKGVTFHVEYDNCNADSNLMSQIISNSTDASFSVAAVMRQPSAARVVMSASPVSRFSVTSVTLDISLVAFDPAAPWNILASRPSLYAISIYLSVVFISPRPATSGRGAARILSATAP